MCIFRNLTKQYSLCIFRFPKKPCSKLTLKSKYVLLTLGFIRPGPSGIGSQINNVLHILDTKVCSIFYLILLILFIFTVYFLYLPPLWFNTLQNLHIRVNLGISRYDFYPCSIKTILYSPFQSLHYSANAISITHFSTIQCDRKKNYCRVGIETDCTEQTI